MTNKANRPIRNLFSTLTNETSLKGMKLDYDFLCFVAKQCRTENSSSRVTNRISLYKSTNVLFLFICFKLVMKQLKFC